MARRWRPAWRLALLGLVAAASLWAGSAQAQLTALRIEDYATAPMTGSVVFPNATANSAYLARLNFMAQEPGRDDRFFVNDLNGPLYIMDKATKQFTTYLDFNRRDGNSGLFEKFSYVSGFANGLITFQFDPDYQNNGKFYTVHMEQPSASGSLIPNNSSFPGFNTAGYTTTPASTTPSGGTRQTVLLEWTDNNVANNSFEGTARELLRLDMSGQIHPLGDIIFNPLAQPGDADWRVMYLAVGDGGAGEGSGGTRLTPQRLDTLNGKILRIVPDLNEHTDTSTVSSNGQYRIPNDNPYRDITHAAVRPELYAVGLRNPHRFSWDVDPQNPESNHLIVNDIGLHTWEEVNIIHRGHNYGYSQREGNEVLISNNNTGPVPQNDVIPVQINATTTLGTETPTYPVALYGHSFSKSSLIGDSISSGYVYRGTRIPELYGKYLFGDITTGQIFYTDFAEMLAADDGDPNTFAQIHSLDILWNNPNDSPNQGEQRYSTTTSGPILGPMHQIAREAYVHRGGQDPNLPGNADVTGNQGRADIRIQVDADGELYILSKSDGMIRAIVGPSGLVLMVDRTTGYVRIRNPSSVDLSIDGYSILSGAGSLAPSDGSWFSLADQGVSGWEEANPTSMALSELNPDEALLIASGGEIDLGRLFIPGAAQDLTFEFLRDGQANFMPGSVIYASLGLPGDYNGDGQVDAADYTVWRDSLGEAGPGLAADGNGDGVVDESDFQYWKVRFGNTLVPSQAAGTSAAVPEPSSAILAAAAILGLAGYRRRRAAAV